MSNKALQYIDFIRVEIFDWVVNFFVNFVNCLKTKEKDHQELQVWKEENGLKYSKYLFSWYIRFQISNINSKTSFSHVEGSDVGLCTWLLEEFSYYLCNFQNFLV